jgi:hypothetical protein
MKSPCGYLSDYSRLGKRKQQAGNIRKTEKRKGGKRQAGLLAQLSLDNGRIACGKTIIGDVSNDDGAGSYYAAPADSYTRTNNDATTQPRVITYCDRV